MTDWCKTAQKHVGAFLKALFDPNVEHREGCINLHCDLCGDCQTPDSRTLRLLRQVELPWHKDCEIIKIPGHYINPKIVVKYKDVFLRYSRGPRQGHFWDIYGEDYQTEELAQLAISQAPEPPQKPLYETYTFKL